MRRSAVERDGGVTGGEAGVREEAAESQSLTQSDADLEPDG